MISQTDIDDWKDSDYIQVIENMPQEDLKAHWKEEDGEIVLDLQKIFVAYGRALHSRIKNSLKG